MDLSSLIHRCNTSHKLVLDMIEAASDADTDIVSQKYEADLTAVLDFAPKSLGQLEHKTRFILETLLGDYDDIDQAKKYFEVLLRDIGRLKKL